MVTEKTQRIAGLDAVRGLAVMGIFAMNVVGMTLPSFAYVDPTFAGYSGPADIWAWAFNFVLFDGKMRALFTMLFGASMALIAERSTRPAETHYRRMFWLFVFGMIHAWLIWYGDILVTYSLCGALGFWLWRQSRRVLVTFGLAMAIVAVGLNLGHYHDLSTARAAAEAPGASAATIRAWDETRKAETPLPGRAEKEIALYRSGFAGALEGRAEMTIFMQTFILPMTIPEVLGFMTLGILLLHSGFFAGAWPRRRLWLSVAFGFGVAAPLTALVARWFWAQDFDFVAMPLADTLSLLCRPFIALAYASGVMLLLQAGRPLARMAAAGRMAFSNYLGTSIIVTTIFNGYGLDLYGQVSRAQLWWVVIGMWVLILLWSKPWLERFHYGPLEWLWRSLARGQRQPFQRRERALVPPEQFSGA
jgi:uncharacterized protein